MGACCNGTCGNEIRERFTVSLPPGAYMNFGVAATIPFFDRNRFVWHAGGNLANNIIVYYDPQTFQTDEM